MSEMVFPMDSSGPMANPTGPMNPGSPVTYAANPSSPDGQHVGALVSRGGIYEPRLMETGKSGFSRLSLSKPGRLFAFSWNPASNGVFCIEPTNETAMLMEQSAWGGAARELGAFPLSAILRGVSLDGKRLLIANRFHLSVIDVPLTATLRQEEQQDEEYYGALSPNGKWTVYVSGTEVYIRSVDGSALGRQISAFGGGTSPRFCLWRGDGKEVLFGTTDGYIWSVTVDAARGQFSTPAMSFKVHWPSQKPSTEHNARGQSRRHPNPGRNGTRSVRRQLSQRAGRLDGRWYAPVKRTRLS
jgi:hypothetical protein